MAFLALFGLNLDRILGWVGNGSYPVLFGLLFACGLGLPLPEDIPLIVAGILIAKVNMTWALAAVFAWCGIIGGDCVLYSLGRRYGLNITKVPFVGKHLSRERIERAEKLFERYGIWVVAVGRLFAGIRGGMVVAAGTIRFNFIKFIIADGLAALVSGGGFMLLGYWFGQNIDTLHKRVGEFKLAIIIVAAVAVTGLVAYIWWCNRTHKPATAAILEKVFAQDRAGGAGGG